MKIVHPFVSRLPSMFHKLENDCVLLPNRKPIVESMNFMAAIAIHGVVKQQTNIGTCRFSPLRMQPSGLTFRKSAKKLATSISSSQIQSASVLVAPRPRDVKCSKLSRLPILIRSQVPRSAHNLHWSLQSSPERILRKKQVY
jgi:hypothetical protein